LTTAAEDAHFARAPGGEGVADRVGDHVDGAAAVVDGAEACEDLVGSINGQPRPRTTVV
jgi:hypothetical protein